MECIQLASRRDVGQPFRASEAWSLGPVLGSECPLPSASIHKSFWSILKSFCVCVCLGFRGLLLASARSGSKNDFPVLELTDNDSYWYIML